MCCFLKNLRLLSTLQSEISKKCFSWNVATSANFCRKKKNLNKMPCSNGQASCWHFSGFPPVYLCRQKIPKVFWAFPNRKKQTLSKQQLPQKWRQLTSRLCCLDRQANWGEDLSLETFGTVYNCPHQGWLRGFKPTMLSFLGPESLSLQLVAKLWSHWKAKRYLYPPVLLREPFLHKGPFFFQREFPGLGVQLAHLWWELLAHGWLDSAVTSPRVVDAR